jgi:F-type H+-transporting ATPase subunit b
VQLLAAAKQVAVLVTAGEADQLPVLPHKGELIFGLIAIAILYIIVKKKVVPNLEKAYADRTAAIEGGMHKAEEAQQQAQAALEQYKTQLAEARVEASGIRQEAQERGAAIIAELRAQAQVEANRMTEAAHKQIEAESLHDETRQSGIVERFIAELESGAVRPETVGQDV